MTMKTKSIVRVIVTFVILSVTTNVYAQKSSSANVAKEKAKQESLVKEPVPAEEALKQVANRILVLQPVIKKIKDKDFKKTLDIKIWSVCPNYPKDEITEMSDEEINSWLTTHFSEGIAYVEFLTGLKEEVNTSR